jgi:hypothetical protein
MSDTKKWSSTPDGCLTPRQTGRLTVGHNITLTLSCKLVGQLKGARQQGHDLLDTQAKNPTPLEAATKQRSEDRETPDCVW